MLADSKQTVYKFWSLCAPVSGGKNIIQAFFELGELRMPGFS